jgi:hypothetical protein
MTHIFLIAAGVIAALVARERITAGPGCAPGDNRRGCWPTSDMESYRSRWKTVISHETRKERAEDDFAQGIHDGGELHRRS